MSEPGTGARQAAAAGPPRASPPRPLCEGGETSAIFGAFYCLLLESPPMPPFTGRSWMLTGLGEAAASQQQCQVEKDGSRDWERGRAGLGKRGGGQRGGHPRPSSCWGCREPRASTPRQAPLSAGLAAQAQSKGRGVPCTQHRPQHPPPLSDARLKRLPSAGTREELSSAQPLTTPFLSVTITVLL